VNVRLRLVSVRDGLSASRRLLLLCLCATAGVLLTFLLGGGCERRNGDPIDVLLITRVSSATLEGPGLDGGSKELTVEQLRSLLSATKPNQPAAATGAGFYKYTITVFAAGEIARLDLSTWEGEVHLRIDEQNYVGGSASDFHTAYRRVLDSE